MLKDEWVYPSECRTTISIHDLMLAHSLHRLDKCIFIRVKDGKLECLSVLHLHEVSIEYGNRLILHEFLAVQGIVRDVEQWRMLKIAGVTERTYIEGGWVDDRQLYLADQIYLEGLRALEVDLI